MNHERKNTGGMKHIILMTLACIIPLLIILAVPFFGISSKWTTMGAIGLMVFLHLLMMKNHSKRGRHH